MAERPSNKRRIKLWRLEHARLAAREDSLAVEEPLEIRVLHQGRRVWQTVTMRTPGADFELAAGLLFSEGLIDSSAAISHIRYCAEANQMYNIVNVALHQPPRTDQLEAFRVASSACGVCGKASLEALETRGFASIPAALQLELPVLYSLAARMQVAQGVFASTGGLHAAGAFTADGALLAVREDVGRHNALDKLIGWSLLNHQSLETSVVLVSGRIGFEIAQKAIAARVPILCALGAPSSLAVQLAERYGQTMIGFLREARANVYSAPERLVMPEPNT